MKRDFIQLATIGAMQRCHPALTALWFQWLGIPDLERARFEIAKTEEGPPGTAINLAVTPQLKLTWAKLCDVLGAAEDAPERLKNPIILSKNSPSHSLFWTYAEARDRDIADSPLEWWWQLLILRRGGLKQASEVLLKTVFGDDDFFDIATVSFVNPTLATGRTTKEMLPGVYSPPTALIVAKPVTRKSKYEGLQFGLTEGTLRVQLMAALTSLATVRTV